MPEPRVLLGRYEVGDLIGAGGSARVHRAHDRLLDRVVAVKLLDAAAALSADPAAHDRFLREARTSAGFAHRRSVATFDAGDADGQLFLVMEYVEGASLAHRIAAEAPMPEAEIVRIGAQVLDALGAAHATGLIHRDVKPANILIDQSGDVKLADFGIAKRFDELSESLTVDGMVIGTRDYLAPEQAAGADIGPPVDLYALGVVLFEMATGVRPARAAVGRAPDPRSVRADISAELATTISTALATRPGDRFASAGAMAAALTGELLPTELSVAAPVRSTPSTLVMPVGGPEVPPTEPISDRPRGGAAATTVATVPASQRATGSGQGWLLVAALVLVAFVAAIVVAARDDSDPAVADDGTASTAATTAGSDAPATTPSTLPSTTPPSTPPTTVPPTTVPVTTTAPTEPPVDELVPGLPATDDLDEFIEQLRNANDVAGKQAKKLSDGLKKIRDTDDSGKRQDRIEDLRNDIDEWVGEDDLNAVVADRAQEFLDELG